MLFVPRRMRVPLVALSGAAIALWGLAGAGFSDRATDILSSAAGAVTVISVSTWTMLGVAYMMRDRDKELLIASIAAEAKRRAEPGRTGPLRRIQ
jgi:hypothetical protein